MARGVARKLPLEWKTDVVAITDTTSVSATAGEFDLDLLPDEIAEIMMIDSTIRMDANGEIDQGFTGAMYLSMDPDASADPLSYANYEDLEVFFNHQWDYEQRVAGSSYGTFGRLVDNKVVKFHERYPVLVGTNFSQVCHAETTADIPTDFITTVYFRRRRATAQELNQILLKRR